TKSRRFQRLLRRIPLELLPGRFCCVKFHLKEIGSLIDTRAYGREVCRIVRVVRLIMALARAVKFVGL
ncbi:hypothetical protein LINPERPRIM_LOCUS37968, partial [Linum perenne]